MTAPWTGWPPSLMQDDCRPLSRWFASRLDARWVVRKVCAEIAATRAAAEIGRSKSDV